MKYAKILVTLLALAAANSLAAHYITRGGTFSPDGSKVAYLSNDVYHGGTVGFAIYTVNADGSARVRFDLKGDVWGAPYFSPDGSKIAFINDDEYYPNEHIFLVDVDGSNLTMVTAYGDDPFEHDDNAVGRTGVLGEGLAFSPDGRKIFYVSEELGSEDIFVINVDGTGKTQLTAFADCDESAPVFLPGGDEILFTVHGSWEKAGIWIMNADGSGKRRLSVAEDVELVTLSPDGKKRAYAGRYAEEYATYVANLDGSSRFKVADAEPRDLDLSFSPDGKKVLYRLGGRVYVVNADGSGRKPLTPAWDYVSCPTFFARGAKIAFVGRKQSGFFLRSNIYTADADGSNLELFKVRERMHIRDLVVSPTGDRFLFRSLHEELPADGEGDYFAVNADGSGLVQLSAYDPPPY